jgi:hypothetical protein
MDIQRLPLAVIAPMILVHSVVGGLLFNFMLDDEIPLLDAIYFWFKQSSIEENKLTFSAVSSA